MNELIEKLKDKDYVRAFGLMKTEEQECLKKAGKKNCLFYGSSEWEPKEADETFCVWQTYAIKPDYQPEPEFVDYEIEMCEGGFLGVHKKFDDNRVLPHEQTYLFCLPSLPNFEGFIEKGVGGTLAIERVARYIDEGKKVYARFRSTK